MTVPPASALYVPTYTSRSPYLTPAEYLASPTGVNVSQLVVGGNPLQNADALSQTISRASSLADDYCYQVLGATLDTQVGRYRVTGEGTIKVPLAFTPVIQVTNVSVGPQPSMMAALPDLSNVWVGRKVAEVPVWGVSFPMPGAVSRTSSGSLYTAVTYVNGYANTVITGATLAGAITLTVDSSLGILPGMQMTIHEPGVSERVNILSIAGSMVTLAAPLVNAHTVGANVSALPESIKQAVVLLTSALIKTRGSEALVMSSMRGQPAKTEKVEDGGLEEIDLAVEWLSRHRRTQ